MKIGVIVMLAVAIVIVRPEITVPAVSEFAERRDGPVVAGTLFPFLFVTIACGALSGFHALIASGTTPKLIEKERQTRFIGYGGMLMESFVAIMALVAAISIDRGIYFAMNSSAAATGGTIEGAVAFVNALGLTGVNLTPEMLSTARPATSARSRSSPAPVALRPWRSASRTSCSSSSVARADGLLVPLRDHVRSAVHPHRRRRRHPRRALHAAGHASATSSRKFSDTSWRPGVWICTAIMVAGWGAILILGVTDPLGGINTLFPLFGIANQLLAAIALAVVLAIVRQARGASRGCGSSALPLAFAAVVTITASLFKIFSPVPAVGYWANHFAFRDALAAGETSFGDGAAPSRRWRPSCATPSCRACCRSSS